MASRAARPESPRRTWPCVSGVRSSSTRCRWEPAGAASVPGPGPVDEAGSRNRGPVAPGAWYRTAGAVQAGALSYAQDGRAWHFGRSVAVERTTPKRRHRRLPRNFEAPLGSAAMDCDDHRTWPAYPESQYRPRQKRYSTYEGPLHKLRSQPDKRAVPPMWRVHTASELHVTSRANQHESHRTSVLD